METAPKTASESAVEIARYRAMSYADYLHTRHWFAVRNRALALALYRCQYCDGKVGLQVHHVSYVRLGAERDEDLRVLCEPCHLGHHFNAVQAQVQLYARILSALLDERGRPEDWSSFVEEAKRRIAQAKIAYQHVPFHAALQRIEPRFPFRPPASKTPFYPTYRPDEPIGKAEAAGLLAKYGGLSGRPAPVRTMPSARPVTLSEVERHSAARVIAQAILECVQRCEALEQEGERLGEPPHE